MSPSVALISVFILAPCLLAGGSAKAQDSLNVTKIGSIPGGNPRDVFVQGNYAYVAAESSLSVVDISNPSAPVQVGCADTPGDAKGVYVTGGYVYVAAGSSGLLIMSGDPFMPFLIDYYDTPGYAIGVYVTGGYAYVADDSSGLRIIDVNNPAAPIEVGYYNTPGSARDVYVSGGYAYVVDNDLNLRIIDVSNPAAPIEVGYYDTPKSANDVYVTGGYAYVVDDNLILRIIDVSDPAGPYEVGQQYIPGYAQGVYVSGGYAYVVGDAYFGLIVIDVRNPTAPIIVGYFDTPRYSEVVYVESGYAYVTDYQKGLQIIDVRFPSSLREVGFYNMLGDSQGIYVTGGYAYVADGDSGLRIIDVKAPAAPIEVGYQEIVEPADVYVTGGYAYVAASGFSYSGLRIIDVSAPAAPIEVGYQRIVESTDVYVTGGYAYVAASGSFDPGLQIIDVSNPAAPYQVGYYRIWGTVQDIFVAGNYAYVGTFSCLGCDWDGLQIVDISNPASPIGVGYYQMPWGAHSVYVSGSYAYITDEYSGLSIIDVSNPALPIKAGNYDTPGYARSVYVEGGYAYVATTGTPYYPGLRIIDVSNPAAPIEVGYHRGAAIGVFVAGGYAYVSCGDCGYSIFQITGADTTPPVQSDWNPPKGSQISVASPTISFITNENADCRWSLTDQDYADMLGDCEGDGSMSQQCNVAGLALGPNTVHIACKDAFGNQDTAETNEHIEYTVDATPPSVVSFVNDGLGEDIDVGTDSDRLSANWATASDPDSGVARYWYCIGTTAGGSDMADWTDNGTNTSVTRTGLSLILGRSYYFSVKAENGAGLFGDVVSSDGQLYMIEGDGLVVPPEEWTAIGSCKTSNAINVSSVFGAASAHFFSFESGKFQYMENPETVALQHGKGYFLISIGPSEVILPDTGNDYTGNSFVFTLDAGWNFISNPYCVPINIGQQNIEMTCDGAPQNDVDFYMYSGEQPEKYVRATMDAGFKMLPRAAYFIKAAQSGCQLTITKD